MSTKFKRFTIFLLLISMLTFPVSASVDYEAITAHFLKAFKEQAPFSTLSDYFFNIADIQPFIEQLKQDLAASPKNRVVEKLLKKLKDPDMYDVTVRKIRRELKSANKLWEKILKYPADDGTPIQVTKLEISINYIPFKIYSIRVRGKYTTRGRSSSFSMRAKFLVVNGKVKIIKFRL